MKNKEKLEFQKLFEDFDNSKIVKGQFLSNPERTAHHFCRLENFDEDCSGIYFLMLDGYVTYVGMSKISIKDRIYGGGLSTGHVYDKIFSDFRFIDLGDMNDMDIKKIEFKYINMFSPPENSMGNSRLFEEYLDSNYIESSIPGKELYKAFRRSMSIQAAHVLKDFWSKGI